LPCEDQWVIFKTMNELITNAEHIHYILSKALMRYHEGKQLTDEEEQVLAELYEVKEEGSLPNINGIKPKPNIHLKFLIMSGVPGMHRKKEIPSFNNPEGRQQYTTDEKGDPKVITNPLDQQILSLEGKTFPETGSELVQILDIIQKGGTINDVYKYCQDNLLVKPLTLKMAYRYSIISYRGEKGKERDTYQDYQLLKKIHENLPLTHEDFVTIKESIKHAYSHPEIVGFCFDEIEKK